MTMMKVFSLFSFSLSFHIDLEEVEEQQLWVYSFSLLVAQALETQQCFFLSVLHITTLFCLAQNFSFSISSLWCCSADRPLRTHHFKAFLPLLPTYNEAKGPTKHSSFFHVVLSFSFLSPLSGQVLPSWCSNSPIWLFDEYFLTESEIHLWERAEKPGTDIGRRQDGHLNKERLQYIGRWDSMTEYKASTCTEKHFIWTL